MIITHKSPHNAHLPHLIHNLPSVVLFSEVKISEKAEQNEHSDGSTQPTQLINKYSSGPTFRNAVSCCVVNYHQFQKKTDACNTRSTYESKGIYTGTEQVLLAIECQPRVQKYQSFGIYRLVCSNSLKPLEQVQRTFPTRVHSSFTASKYRSFGKSIIRLQNTFMITQAESLIQQTL